MEITVKRPNTNLDATVSELYIDGVFFSHVVEDKDRGLFATMPLEEIKAKKVWGKTCIPYGRYEVVISYSNRFQKMLPLLMNVPGYLGIRIHPGNTAEDTDGCLCPGIKSSELTVRTSRVTFSKLFSLIQKALKKEKVHINIVQS